MIHFRSFFLLVLFIWSHQILADHAQLKFVGNPTGSVEVGEKKIPIYGEAKIFHPGAPEGTTVYLTGAGVRKKKIAFIDADCYVISSYVKDPAIVNPKDPMTTIADQSSKAVYLVMVRDISADLIRSSFEDSLEANDVDLEKPGIRDLLSKITFDMPESQSVSFLGIHQKGREYVHAETSMGNKFSSEDEILSRDFWSSWFGISVDAHMANLKSKLIGQ